MCGSERERDRQREREREQKREGERQTERERQRETERQREEGGRRERGRALQVRMCKSQGRMFACARLSFRRHSELI